MQLLRVEPSPKVIERKPVMTLTWLSRYWRLGMVGALAMAGALSTVGDRALAQIRPDNTLGAESSRVTSPSPGAFVIDGGATRGANLFHSFSQFSVPTNGVVAFNNAVRIQNIISRVTGGSVSNIDGLLKANASANLFLINPNGIIFGPNASLNIGGSFVASTANAIGFGNQGVFSATNPESPSSLLTVNPSALLFNQIQTASIQNNSVAPSGLDPSLNPSSEFTATGLRVPDGKSLLLVGGDINMDGSGLYAFGGRVELGGLAGVGMIGLNENGNNLSLSFPDRVARSDVFLSNGAGVDVAAGDGGSITVNARNLEMTGESVLVAGIARGLGSNNSNAGNIEINATGVINLNKRSAIVNQVLPEASGQGGNINISASKLQVEGAAQVSTSTVGAGKGGSLTVHAQDVQLIGELAEVQDGSGLFTSGLSTDANSTGDGGDLTVKTNTLLVKDGAQVASGTFGAGKGGSLTVHAQDVQLIGTSADGRAVSGLFNDAQPNSTGDGGDLTVKTNTLLVQDGAQVNVQGSGTGTAGNVTLNARSIRLNNNALLTANTQSAKVDPTREQATININSRDLIMRSGSNIRTNATGENVIGGNININSDIIAALENSDISANSAKFRGGRVTITTQGIFGTEFRDTPTSKSDITATGGSPEFSGTVQINTLGIDPTQGFANVPVIPVDTSVAQGCYSGGSQARSEFIITGRGGLPHNPGEALNTDAVQVDLMTLNPKVAQPFTPAVAATSPASPTPPPIVEAQGWVKDANGNIVLTANVSTVTPHNSWQKTADCRALNQQQER